MIRAVMGYSLSSDIEASKILYNIAVEMKISRRLVDINDFCTLAKNSDVCIAGGSICLEKYVHELYNCSIIAAADGAVSLLLRNGIVPEIVFSDLDGSWHDILLASYSGSIIVVHGHGDNVHSLLSLVPRLERILATVQTQPLQPYTHVLGGFTDGDRAVFGMIYCGAKKITLYGMNFSEKVGWWSKPWLRRSVPPWPEKRRKLELARHLLEIAKKLAFLLGIEIINGCRGGVNGHD